MGIYAAAWFDYSAAAEAVPSILNHSCSGVALWPWDNADPRREQWWCWEVEPSEERPDAIGIVVGPGFQLAIYPKVCALVTAHRWRQFVVDVESGTRARRAGVMVARALGASRIIWAPDYIEAPSTRDGVNATIDTMRGQLCATHGGPQASTGLEMPSGAREQADALARIWYDEKIQ